MVPTDSSLPGSLAQASSAWLAIPGWFVFPSVPLKMAQLSLIPQVGGGFLLACCLPLHNSEAPCGASYSRRGHPECLGGAVFTDLIHMSCSATRGWGALPGSQIGALRNRNQRMKERDIFIATTIFCLLLHLVVERDHRHQQLPAPRTALLRGRRGGGR